jgi:hypothetical protein
MKDPATIVAMNGSPNNKNGCFCSCLRYRAAMEFGRVAAKERELKGPGMIAVMPQAAHNGTTNVQRDLLGVQERTSSCDWGRRLGMRAYAGEANGGLAWSRERATLILFRRVARPFRVRGPDSLHKQITASTKILTNRTLPLRRTRRQILINSNPPTAVTIVH